MTETEAIKAALLIAIDALEKFEKDDSWGVCQDARAAIAAIAHTMKQADAPAISGERKKTLLRERGWHTYYSENYWVHPKTIVDSSRQDYTEYGMNLGAAYEYELDQKSGPFNGQFCHGALRW